MAQKLRSHLRGVRFNPRPSALPVALPQGTNQDDSPAVPSARDTGRRVSPKGSAWSKKLLKETENKPSATHAVRDDGASGYLAMTSTRGISRTPPLEGEERFSIKHVSVATCGIIALVFVAISCGSWFGAQLGAHAMTRVSKAAGSKDSHNNYPGSMAPGAHDADLIQANWTAASAHAAAAAHARGATAAQQRLEHSSSATFLDKPETVRATKANADHAFVRGGTTSNTPPAISVVATSIRTSSRKSSSTTSRSSMSTVMQSSTKSVPSLFCFSILRCNSYELSLVRTQLAKELGIFACNAYSVLSDEQMWLTPGPPTRIETTKLGISLEVESTTDDHILNAGIFFKVWEQVKSDGLYMQHDWTVKADPDAVFFPRRLRDRLVRMASVTSGASVYLLNCRLGFGLFGALEVMSQVAMLNLYDGIEQCKKVLPWRSFGEDMFLRKCLDILKVTQRTDFGLLSEANCGEQPSPCISGKVAFHPFKSVEAYLKC